MIRLSGAAVLSPRPKRRTRFPAAAWVDFRAACKAARSYGPPGGGTIGPGRMAFSSEAIFRPIRSAIRRTAGASSGKGQLAGNGLVSLAHIF